MMGDAGSIFILIFGVAVLVDAILTRRAVRKYLKSREARHD